MSRRNRSIDANRASDLKARAGMSLVEIMVAMVVLSFGLLGVAALQVRAITEGSGGAHLSAASAQARNRIEVLGRLAWDNAALDHDAGNWSAVTPIAGGQGQNYSLQERITWDDTAVADVQLKQIEVRVSWDDTKRQGRQVLLTSTRLREMDE